MDNCSSCKFFLDHDIPVVTYSGGHCRRYPPVNKGNRTGFPYVDKLSWCGEYQQKPVPLPPEYFERNV